MLKASLIACLQVTLKKQHGSLRDPRSYIVNAIAVATSYVRHHLLWFNEICDLNKKTLKLGQKVAGSHSRPELSTPSAAIEYTRRQLAAGTVPRECIGKHGKPGLAYPPLSEYDDVHLEVVGACVTSYPQLVCAFPTMQHSVCMPIYHDQLCFHCCAQDWTSSGSTGKGSATSQEGFTFPKKAPPFPDVHFFVDYLSI